MTRLLPVLSLSALSVLFLSACFSPTQSTIREYDATGKLAREAVTSESVVKTVTESTKSKTVVAWDNSWLAYVTATTSTTEDATPTLKMGVGRSDKGLLTISEKHAAAIAPNIIKAARSGEISVSASGIGASSTDTPPDTPPVSSK